MQCVDVGSLPAQAVSQSHQGEFPRRSYLKVKGSTKNVVSFLVLVRGIFFISYESLFI